MVLSSASAVAIITRSPFGLTYARRAVSTGQCCAGCLLKRRRRHLGHDHGVESGAG